MPWKVDDCARAGAVLDEDRALRRSRAAHDCDFGRVDAFALEPVAYGRADLVVGDGADEVGLDPQAREATAAVAAGPPPATATSVAKTRPSDSGSSGTAKIASRVASPRQTT